MKQVPVSSDTSPDPPEAAVAKVRRFIRPRSRSHLSKSGHHWPHCRSRRRAAINHLSEHSRSMRFNPHSPPDDPRREGRPPNQKSGIQEPMCKPGRPGRDTSTPELGIINLITQQDVGPHQQLARRRRERLRVATPIDQALIEDPQLRVAAHGALRRLDEQVTQQPRSGLADPAPPLLVGRGALARLEPNVSRDLAPRAETARPARACELRRAPSATRCRDASAAARRARPGRRAPPAPVRAR